MVFFRVHVVFVKVHLLVHAVNMAEELCKQPNHQPQFQKMMVNEMISLHDFNFQYLEAYVCTTVNKRDVFWTLWTSDGRQNNVEISLLCALPSKVKVDNNVVFNFISQRHLKIKS